MEIRSSLPWFLILCIIFLIASIISNILQMVKAQERLSNAQKKVLTLEKEQQRLITEKAQQESSYYLESQIRNNLKLVKPGESLVVIPEHLMQQEEETVYKYSPKDEKDPVTVPPISKWRDLIL